MNFSPTTYAAWSDLISQFERGEDDQAVLSSLIGAKMPGGVPEERLNQRVVDAFSARMRRITDNVTKGFERGMDEVHYVQAIAAARRELTLVSRFATAGCWGERLGKAMTDSLDSYIKESQKNIETEAKRFEREDQGRRLSMVRRYPIAIDAPLPPADAAATTDQQTDPAPAPGPAPTRRILF